MEVHMPQTNLSLVKVGLLPPPSSWNEPGTILVN